MNSSSSSPPATPHRTPPQISLGFMMLIMLTLAIICAGFYRASRVPAVMREVYTTLGRKVPDTDKKIAKSLQVRFVLFTYTAPLIAAGILSTVVNVRKWLGMRNRKTEDSTSASDSPWKPHAIADRIPIESNR